VSHVECRKLDRPSLAFLAEVLARVQPGDTPTSNTMEYLFRQTTLNLDERYRDSWTPERARLAEEWPALLHKLVKSSNDTARLYGRLGLFHQSVRKLGDRRVADKAAIRAAIAEADDILEEIGDRRRRHDGAVHTLTEVKRGLWGSIDPALDPDSPRDPPVFASLGRLRFQPLEVTVAADGASAASPSPVPFTNMLNCGGRFDVYWTDKALYWMERKGVLRPLPISGHPDWSRRHVLARDLGR
jgi:hypothetical protein